MEKLLPAALAFAGIHNPTPIKYWWFGMTVASLLLKIGVIWRIRFLAFRVYIAATFCATILQNSDYWGLTCEVALAIALLLVSAEVLYITAFKVVHAAARMYDYQFSLIIGAIVLAALLFMAPPPYAGYPKSWYFTRLYTTFFAVAIVASANVVAWSTAELAPWSLRLHSLLFIPWLGVTAWTGFVRGMDRWSVALIGISVQIGCLIGWWVSSAIGSTDRSNS